MAYRSVLLSLYLIHYLEMLVAEEPSIFKHKWGRLETSARMKRGTG
jgi:hypothetical protein